MTGSCTRQLRFCSWPGGRRPQSCGLALLTATLMVVGPLRLAPAHAAKKPTIVVLGLEPGDGSQAVANELSQALRSQARKADARISKRKDTLAEMKLGFGCMSEAPNCMAQVAKNLGADRLVYGSVKRAGAGYTVTLKLLDVATGTVERFVTEPLSEAQSRGAALEARAAQFVGALLGSTRGSLSLVAPKGATVTIDGQRVGTATGGPLVVPDLAAGQHQLEVSREGYLPHRQTIQVPAGGALKLEVRLQRIQLVKAPVEPPPTAGTASPNRASRIAFWATASTAAAMGVLTLVFFLRTRSAHNDLEMLVNSGQLPGPANEEERLALNADACAFYSGPRLQQSVQDICSRGNTGAILANAFGAVAAASTVVAGYFLWRGYIRSSDGERAPARAARPSSLFGSLRLRLAPEVSPQGAGAFATLEF